MADETKPAETNGQGGGSLIRTIGLVAAVVAVAGAGGLAAFMFVLAPMLTSEAVELPEDAIPITAVEVSFDPNYVNLLMPSEDMPASMLLFSITLSCADRETADVIQAHKARFSDMIMKLHDGRTRAEVMNDPRILKESIQKQVVQEANQLLRRLQGNHPGLEPRVLDALHTQFAASDSL